MEFKFNILGCHKASITLNGLSDVMVYEYSVLITFGKITFVCIGGGNKRGEVLSRTI